MAIKQFSGQISASLAYYYIEDYTWMDSSSTGKQKILDAKLTRTFKVGANNGSLSLVLKNMLSNYSDYREHPRNVTSPKISHDPTAYIDLRISF